MKNISGLNLWGNKEYFHGRMCYYGSQLAYVCGHAVEGPPALRLDHEHFCKFPC